MDASKRNKAVLGKKSALAPGANGLRKGAMTPADSPSVPPTNVVPPAPGSSRTIIVKEYDFFKVVQDYLERASRTLDLADFVRAILSQPKNELIINFPVRMDSGEVRLFKGYRVQHNNLLGPFKGGM